MPEVVGKGSTGADGKIEIDVSGEGQYEIRILSVDGKGGDGGGAGDDDAGAGKDYTPADKKAQGLKLHPQRNKILATADAEMGKVSNSGGEGGKRKGWDRMQTYFQQTCRGPRRGSEARSTMRHSQA